MRSGWVITTLLPFIAVSIGTLAGASPKSGMRRAQAASPRRSASARRHSTISVHTDHPAAKAVPSRSTRATTGRRTMAKRPARAPGQKKKESADKPGFVVGSHSSGSCVAAGFKQPTRERRGPRHSSPIWSCSRWGLPCHAALTPHAVRSYRTVSPLPRVAAATRKTGCADTVRRFAFCCTFRRLTSPRRYLAPCPAEPGLSSPCRNTSRLPGRLQRAV